MNLKSSKILIIAPFPPPTNGQSKIAKRVSDALEESGASLICVDINRRSVKRGWLSQIVRIYDLFYVFREIYINVDQAKSIYFSLSESFLGNLKDIVIYILIWKKLQSTYIHMLGGSGMKNILNKSSVHSRVNGIFIKKVNRILVEGRIGSDIFKKYSNSNVVILKNCVDDYLLSSVGEVSNKYANTEIIKVLYLSNMIRGKGYLNLLEAYLSLDTEMQSKFELTFVGGFQSSSDKSYFMNRLNGQSNVKYIGEFIDGEEKKALYLNSHIFCLPTYYPYEGQPISIIEAYSTGCVVITCNHAGIPEIFTEGVNGYYVESNNIDSISNTLLMMYGRKDEMINIALRNRLDAKEKYSPSRYNQEVLETFNLV